MKISLLFLSILFIITFISCSKKPEPSIPQYLDSIVVEKEPRLSANAEIIDITGDGLNDIVLAIGRHWPGPNLLLVGSGNGGFSTADTLTNTQDRTYSVSAADMDKDGDLDLVVSNDHPDAKYVLINDGNGVFRNRVEFGDPMWPTRNSTIADLNQDGLPDIVVANRDVSPEGNNWVCLNKTEVNLILDCKPLISGSATTISVTDMNSDGFNDLIIPYRDGGQSHIYIGDGSGSFEQGPLFGPNDASYRSAIALDMNNDLLPDLIAIDDRKRTTTVFYQTENFAFSDGTRIDDGEMMPYALDKADLDNNGTDDVIVGYREAPTRIFFNRSQGIVQAVIGDSLGAAYGFGIGDFNHDGIQDIVSARSGASDVLYLGRIPGN